MANAKENESINKLEGKLTNFIAKRKTILIVCAAVVVLALAGVWIGLSVNAKATAANQLTIDLLQEDYEAWMAMEDQKSEEAVKALEALTGALNDLSKKGNKYPAIKATYLLGLTSYAQEDFQTARERFLAAYEKDKETYLAPLSLMNAAVCSERLGDNAKALEQYQSVYDQFGSEAPEAPKALFSVARLHEAAKNIDLAKAVFQQLADEFSSSEYAKLAKTRLVTLQ